MILQSIFNVIHYSTYFLLYYAAVNYVFLVVILFCCGCQVETMSKICSNTFFCGCQVVTMSKELWQIGGCLSLNIVLIFGKISLNMMLWFIWCKKCSADLLPMYCHNPICFQMLLQLALCRPYISTIGSVSPSYFHICQCVAHIC